MRAKKVNLHKPEFIVALSYSDDCRGLLALWRRRGRCQLAIIHWHSGARSAYIFSRRRRFLKSYGDGAWSMDQVTCCSERWRVDPALFMHGVSLFYAFDVFHQPHGIG
jgi:hypothetical protein